jgi:hypothetical protein
VADTIGDLDNVLFEVSNESHPGATAWQYEMIRALRNLESSSGHHHPIGMTAMWREPPERNASLLESPADWIAPHDNAADRYSTDPPPSTGRKVIVTDTDHIWGIGGDPRWVWKSFFRGLNPIFMDPYVTAIRRNLPAWPAPPPGYVAAPAAEWEGIRTAMGYTRAIADRIDLTTMTPRGDLASSGYCLADPGKEYLVYFPSRDGRLQRLRASVFRGLAGERGTVDLTAANGPLDAEWINTEQGVIVPSDSIMGGGHIDIRAPFPGQAVLHLKARTGAGGK